MAGKLVTVARFEQGGRAHLARGTLEAAGIKAVVTDEEVVAMDWLLGGAVGWVKVQVLEENADRAVEVLEEALGPDAGPVDEQALAAEAEATPPGGAGEGRPAAVAPAPAGPDPVPGGPSEHDDYARRAFLAAVFSLLFPPLILYALYLMLRSGAAAPASPLMRVAAGVLMLLGCLALVLVVGTIVADFVRALFDGLTG